MTIFRLTHCYSSMQDHFFGVESSLSEYEINLRCAYIQCIRERLPLLPCTQAFINEMSCMILLHEFYGIRQITTPRRYNKCIDLHQNWIDYCFPSCNMQDSLNDVSVENASHQLLTLMYKEAEEHVSMLAASGSNDLLASVIEMDNLREVIKGTPVSPAWGWTDINGHSLAGKRYTQNFNYEMVT